VELWDWSTLRLIADNDLTHHHNVEISHTDVSRAATADLFHHPTFRPATPVEIEFAHQVINDAGYEIYVWDAESSAGTAPMMIIATSVRVVEGLVRHGNCARQRRTLGAADPDGRPR
jgi:hypothetical protein